MSYLSYKNLTALEEFSFIGGSETFLDFQFSDERGVPKNLEGWEVYFRMSPYGSKNVATLFLDGELLFNDPTTIRITIPYGNTSLLKGKYVYQLEIRRKHVFNDSLRLLEELTLENNPSHVSWAGKTQPSSYPRLILFEGNSPHLGGLEITIDGLSISETPMSETITLPSTGLVSTNNFYQAIEAIDVPAMFASGDKIKVYTGGYIKDLIQIPAEGNIIVHQGIGF